ncbi:hypothetical protein POM88_022134 [Heracleum sosnowskyi]|uniref:Uncharacterized protein n=1 Tax=Heracleum sosnowskyi TaxID=360622 RepID=A0AAD8IEQ8_9APIA|nr:hypothetical protein POM88_022134 [Heracleum sosnowskyi]
MRSEEKNNHRVIIATFVESTKRLPRPKRDGVKRVELKPFCNKPQNAKPHGYDRKAQLLAYAKQLRNSNPPHLNCPTTHSSSKSKKRRWIRILSPAKFSRSICGLFDRTSREPWRYQRLESGGDNGFNIRNFHFCRRLRKLMKVWSSSCNCKRSVF